MTQDLVRNAEKNPHISAISTEKSTCLAVHRTTMQHTLNNKTYMAELPERSLSYNLNTKLSLKYAKENTEKPEAFWDNVLWTDEKKLTFGHHQRRYHWEKTGWSLCRDEHFANCSAWRWIHYALGLCGNLGHRKYCVSGRKNGFHQILKTIKNILIVKGFLTRGAQICAYNCKHTPCVFWSVCLRTLHIYVSTPCLSIGLYVCLLLYMLLCPFVCDACLSSYVSVTELCVPLSFRLCLCDSAPTGLKLYLSLSLSLKREMRMVSEECALQPVTVAMAFVYFEKLVLQGRLNKQNRKLVSAACVLLAAKISSDMKKQEVKVLIDVSLFCYVPIRFVFLALIICIT